MAMTPFRRSAMSNSAMKPRGGGGGGWYDKYKLPQGNAAPFVLINSEYLDPAPAPDRVETGPDGRPIPVKNLFYKFKQHTKKSFKNGKEFFPKETCSKGWEAHNPKPCAVCMAQDMGDKTLSLSERFAFGIVHLSQYHRHPLVDRKTNQVRMKQDNSGPYMTYSECDGRTCNFCRIKAGQAPVIKQGEFFPQYNPADVTTEFGHRRYIEVGKNHLANLMDWDGIISSQCSAHILNPQGQLLARCSQQLTRNSFNCPHCNNVLIDMSNDPRTDEEINAAISQPYTCLTCQKYVFVKEVVSCETCAGAGRQFVQLGIGDVVLWGKRQGEGTQSQMSLHQFQTIDEFQRSLPPHIQQLLGGKSVTDIIKELASPFDFDHVFAPRSMEDQAKQMELNIQLPGQQNPSMYAQPMQGQQPQQFMQPPMGAMGMPPPMHPHQAQQPQQPPYQPQVAPYAPYAPQPQGAPAPGPLPAPVPFKPNFSK